MGSSLQKNEQSSSDHTASEAGTRYVEDDNNTGSF